MGDCRGDGLTRLLPLLLAIILLLLSLLLLGVLVTPVGAVEGLSMEEAYREYARQQAREVGIDPDMLEAQIWAESKFDPNAWAPGGVGIAQINMAYHDVNAWDPWASIRYMAKLMASYLEEYNGSWDLALAAYSSGSGTVRRWGGVPPYPSVRWYISSVRGGVRGD